MNAFKEIFKTTAADYAKDTAGNFAIIFAVSIFAIIAGLACAIDGANAYFAKQRLQDTTDVIALMAARGGLESNSELTQAAQDYFDLHYPGQSGGRIIINNIQRNGDQVTVNASNNLDTFFTGIFGFSNMDVSAQSSAIFSERQLNLALVLDTTGSMQGPKLASLKVAAGNLIDRLDENNSNDNVSVSVVPFAQYVNVGRNNVNANWLELTTRPGESRANWNGCVGSRLSPYDQRVEFGSVPIPAYTTLPCGSEISPLNKNLNRAKTSINGLVARGWTYMPSGLIWGWRTLDGDVPFTQAGSSNASNTDKILVLMTDGTNTRSKSGTAHEAWSQIDADRQTEEMCTRVKRDDIVIYTIAYEVSDVNTQNLMRDCASIPENFFNSSSASDLNAAFDQIGRNLVELRLSM